MLQPKVKKAVKKKSTNPADSYPSMKDARGNATIGGGEGTTPPFTRKEMEYKKKMTGLPKGKMGKTVAKAKNGSSLGMKSVKAGYDNNPGVTRADIITAATKKAKSGSSIKKAQNGYKSNPGFNELASKSQKFPAKSKPTSNTKLLDSSIKKGKAINAYQGKKGMLAKSGTSMKKCKYGCS
jgi:hypothetical protein